MTRERRTRPATPDVCPVCGEEVPRGALACPECGADHNTGWRKDADAYDGVDLPDDDFNYDDFVKQEFGSRAKPPQLKMIWWIAGILLIVAFLLMYFYAAH
jgi:predicted nucleic acid-binding Zn ribbon protein